MILGGTGGRGTSRGAGDRASRGSSYSGGSQPSVGSGARRSTRLDTPNYRPARPTGDSSRGASRTGSRTDAVPSGRPDAYGGLLRGGTGSRTADDVRGDAPRVVDLTGASRPRRTIEVPRLVGATETPSSVRRRALEARRSGALSGLGARESERRTRTLTGEEVLKRYRGASSRENAPAARPERTRPETTPRARSSATPVRPWDRGTLSGARRAGLEDARRAALERLTGRTAPTPRAQGALPAEGRESLRPVNEAADSARARKDARASRTKTREAASPRVRKRARELRERAERTLARDENLRRRAVAASAAAAVAVDVAVRGAIATLPGGVDVGRVGGGWSDDLADGGYDGGYDDGYHDGYHDGWWDGYGWGAWSSGGYWYWHYWYPSFSWWWCGGVSYWGFGFYGGWGFWPWYPCGSWWSPWVCAPRYYHYPWSYWFTAPYVSYTSVVYEDDGWDDDVTIYIEDEGGADVTVIEDGEEVYPADAPAAADAAPPAEEPAFAGPSIGRAATEYLALGDRAFVQGRYADAVRLYAKAIEFAPDDAVLYLVLSDALFATGDYHYAAYSLRRALELEPELAEVVVDKRQYYGDPADFERHLAQCERYLEDHFLDDDARLVLAANYLFGGAPEKAVSLLEAPFAQELVATPAGKLLLESARRAASEAKTAR